MDKENTGKFGFEIGGGDEIFFVQEIAEDGAAALDGRLRNGDLILRVNSTTTINATKKIFEEALKSAENILQLVKEKNKIFILKYLFTFQHVKRLKFKNTALNKSGEIPVPPPDPSQCSPAASSDAVHSQSDAEHESKKLRVILKIERNLKILKT